MSEKLKIYLDNCCLNRPFDMQSNEIIELETKAKLIIQQSIKDRELIMVSSFMIDSENLENPFKNNSRIINIFLQFASEYCSASEDILFEAKQFLNYGLKHKDSLHLACAIKSKCDYLLTTDKKFLNKNDIISKIQIVNPITFLLKIGDLL